MHAKKPVYLLVLPIAVMLACTNSNNPGTTGSNSMNTVEAGAPDGSPTVDKDVIPDLPIADVPIADAPDAAVCDQLAANARTQFESYLQITSSLACQVDSDCSLLGIQALNCVGGCGGPLVRTADISAVTAATANICDQYFGAGCPAKYSPCPNFQAVCDYGTCTTAIGRGGLSNATDAAVDAGTGEVPIDGVGANRDNDAGTDSPMDTGDPVDGGSEGGGTVQCNFPGVSQALTCAGGEYCMAFGGGIPIDSGISYTCAPFPEACVADRSCACICSTASSNPTSYCAVRGQQCICSVSQGILTLLCAAP